MQHPRKKSSVLGCFRDTFVMRDIFGSKKILCPALALNSTIHTLPPRPLKILAHWRLSPPNLSTRCAPQCHLRRRKILGRSRYAASQNQIQVALRLAPLIFSSWAGLQRHLLPRPNQSCEVARCDIFNLRKILRPALVSWCARRSQELLKMKFRKILRPACLVSKFGVTYGRSAKKICLESVSIEPEQSRPPILDPTILLAFSVFYFF